MYLFAEPDATQGPGRMRMLDGLHVHVKLVHQRNAVGHTHLES